ncbi:MAG: sulfotransferase [Myxococcota bacterium]
MSRPSHPLAPSRPSMGPEIPEPFFLFILNPPFSGSTALARLLCSVPGSAILNALGEGLRYLPRWHETNRWDDRAPPPTALRDIWMGKLAQNAQDFGEPARIIIEKSPPLLVHLDAVLEMFPRYGIFGFNRDPYGFCASVIRRQIPPLPGMTLAHSAAARWLRFSQMLRRHIDARTLLWLRYEDLCDQPKVSAARLIGRFPQLRGVDFTRPLSVKNRPPQPLANHNSHQIAQLSREQRAHIAETLHQDPETVRFFGYAIEPMR